jgi:hypothetical protein
MDMAGQGLAGASVKGVYSERLGAYGLRLFVGEQA